jgi:hypothetical protein
LTTAELQPAGQAQPWERQPDEPRIAYAAFREYLSLGRFRSFESLSKKLGRTGGNYGQMARKHNWFTRAEAFDRDREEREESDLRQLRLEAERTRGRRELVRRDRIWDVCEKLLETVTAMLAKAEATGTWSGVDIARICDVIEKLSRAACEPFATNAAATQNSDKTLLAGNFELYAPNLQDERTATDQDDPADGDRTFAAA